MKIAFCPMIPSHHKWFLIKKVLILFLFSTLILFFSLSALAKDLSTPVNIYIGHKKPPYIINYEKKIGLYFDLVKFINKEVNKDSTLYPFKIIYIPRKRLNRDLRSGNLDGLVLGANPIWYKDKSKTTYIWSPGIFKDKDVVISTSNDPFEYTTPQSFKDKVLVGVAGYYYQGVDELVSNRKIVRINVEDESKLVKMLIMSRGDVGIIGLATLKSILFEHPKWAQKLHISKKDFSHSFYRYILCPKDLVDTCHVINPVLTKILNNASWKRVESSYYIK